MARPSKGSRFHFHFFIDKPLNHRARTIVTVSFCVDFPPIPFGSFDSQRGIERLVGLRFKRLAATNCLQAHNLV